jgi:membrane-bound metal-dependent hydrolase YbcI (DUF457 family)
MPKRDTHLIAGAVVGCMVYVGIRALQGKEVNPLSLLLSGAGGAIGGELPDILEPATSPNHRAVFHSVLTGAITTYSSTKIYNSNEIEDDVQAVLIACVGGYLTHLMLDAGTSKSLPLL